MAAHRFGHAVKIRSELHGINMYFFRGNLSKMRKGVKPALFFSEKRSGFDILVRQRITIIRRISMEPDQDRRGENRLRFSWPLWFGYNETGEFHRGQVVDLTQDIVSFTVPENQTPGLGSSVLTRFSFPLPSEDRFDLGSYYQWSEVIRVDQARQGRNRIAMRLRQPIENELATAEAPLCFA
jgi:hypothetical protein